MFIREITVAELESSKVGAEAAEQAFHMDEQTFRVFYESTARPLWSYLSRILGNATLADDLVQESYFRFLRATLKSDDAAYQKAYLFRIATNLARDHWRRLPHQEQGEAADLEQVPADDRTAEHVQQRSDLGRVLGRLKPRERELLWLAYVGGREPQGNCGSVGPASPQRPPAAVPGAAEDDAIAPSVPADE